VRSTVALMDYISQARRNKKTTLVILSDGYDTSSAQGIDIKTKREITRIGKLAISGHYTDITVYVVGATPEISEILKAIATKSGGKIFPVK
jgi:Mg-chelatase subunit ChlD